MWCVSRIGILIWLVILAIEDWKTRSVAVKWLFLACGGVLAYLVCSISTMTELMSHIGGAIWGGLFLLIGKYTKEKIGYGDGVILLILGMYLGMWEFIEVSLLAFFMCAIYGIIQLAKRTLHKKDGVAFIPFLTLSYAVHCCQNKNLRLKASATIEMIYIMPVIFLVFLVTVYLGFFFHDKNVLQGLVYEATVIGSEKFREEEEIDEAVLLEFLQNKSQERLLYFPVPEVEVVITDDTLAISAITNKYNMNIAVEKSVPLIIPEIDIRSVNIIGGAIDGSD